MLQQQFDGVALEAAQIVMNERVTLLAAFQKLNCHDKLVALPIDVIIALVRLEHSQLGAPSNLMALPNAPLKWAWLRWKTGPDRLAVLARGQLVNVRRLRPEPRMAHLEGFLSADECAHIIKLGLNGGELHPSRVVKHDRKEGEAGGVITAARTSENCRVSAQQDIVVRRVVQRAAYLAGLTPDHAEAVQVVHYTETQQYRPHYDFFDPCDSRYADRCGVQGNRLISVFAYLSGCEGGGKTAFPRLVDTSGKRMAFEPKVGCAVWWYNIDRNGQLDDNTLHAGEPVAKGEKWGLNVWLRERPRVQRPQKCVQAKMEVLSSAIDISDSAAAAPPTAMVKLRLSAKPKPPTLDGVTKCEKCGDKCGPIGLCLCRDNYVV